MAAPPWLAPGEVPLCATKPGERRQACPPQLRNRRSGGGTPLYFLDKAMGRGKSSGFAEPGTPILIVSCPHERKEPDCPAFGEGGVL